MTTLNVDSTCIDTLMEYHVSVQTKDFHMGLLKSLFEQDLQITRYTFGNTAHRSLEGLVVLAGIRYENFISPLLDGSELLEAVFLKSDHQLRNFLHQPKYSHALNADTLADALIMSTITGWVDGCRVLLNPNLVEYLEDLGSDARRSSQTLLMLSAATDRLDMLQFWLSQRETCGEPLLNLIGHFEDALSLGWFRPETPTMDVVQLVSSHIIKQRHEIKLLMKKHELQLCCESARTSLPDAHMGCILTALVTGGIDVPPRYWPKRKSLYHMPHMWKSDVLNVLRKLELASICDVGQEDFKCNKDTACSPLVYLATQYMEGIGSGCLTERNLVVRWLLSRGANLRETWPGTYTAAVHCLALQSAQCLQDGDISLNSDDPSIMQDSWSYKDYEFLAKEEILDKCECGCSGSGCDFLSCFWKHTFAESRWCPQFPLVCEPFKTAISARYLGNVTLYAPDHDDDEIRHGLRRDFLTRILLDLTIWIETAATTLSRHQLIDGYIRLFVFSYLEITHTCCDIHRIQHWDNPDYTRRPYPRYSPKELQRINEEDAHLRARLEELVPELISQYDSFGGQLQDFVIDVLIPTMRRTAKELKEEDKTLYATGRKELGVVMDEDEDESEEESSEVEEEETDAEEDSDEEY